MYRICVHGRLTEWLAAAIEWLPLHAGAVNTVFTGEVKDHSQLYGLLDRLRDRARAHQRAAADPGRSGNRRGPD
jgi:hypothetical protein